MLKERAMELVAALRSGGYVKGRNCLTGDGRFCCLGVACDISGVGEWVAGGKLYRAAPEDASGTMLPAAVKKYFGMDSSAGRRRDNKPIVIDTSVYASLMDANDHGCTFEEIADYIEKNWEDL